VTERIPPHSLLYARYHYKPFHFPVSFKSKYQVTEISLVKLNSSRAMIQPVEKVMASVTGSWGSEGCEMENYKAQASSASWHDGII
jgi:hypothetical protein